VETTPPVPVELLAPPVPVELLTLPAVLVLALVLALLPPAPPELVVPASGSINTAGWNPRIAVQPPPTQAPRPTRSARTDARMVTTLPER
jgi:hypothetical protein